MHAKLFRPHQYFSNPISAIITILLLSLIIPRHYAKKDSELYKACREKNTSACGKPVREGIEFPFWGHDIRSQDCGLGEFELSCDESGLVVDIGSQYKFHVVEINLSAKVLQLNHNNPLDYICGSSSSRFPDATLNEKLYHYSQSTEHLHLFYHCSDEAKNLPTNLNFTCPNEDEDRVYFIPRNLLTQAQKDELSSCTNTTLPVDSMVLQELVRDPIKLQPPERFRWSFEVFYYVPSQEACTECMNAGGLCWTGTYYGSNDTCLYQSGVAEPENESRGGATYGILPPSHFM